MIKRAFFDLDDTFLKTQQGYDSVNEDNAKLLVSLLNISELTLSEVLQVKDQIDYENTKKFGLGKDRFPKTWRDVYLHFTEKHSIEPNEEDIQQIYDGAQSIFDIVLDTYGDIHQVLSEIENIGIEINLLTSGDSEIQNKRINDYDIGKYFSNIYIYPLKTTDTMLEVLQGGAPDESVMIGNSLRSDIHPALHHNMHAIHIQRDTWAYDHYDVNLNHTRYINVKSLSEAVDALKKLVDLH